MIRLITDSAADFEPGELERMQVTCIPLSVMFGIFIAAMLAMGKD